MILHPDGLYLHNLSTGSVVAGVAIVWIGAAVVIYVALSLFGQLMLRRTLSALTPPKRGRERWN